LAQEQLGLHISGTRALKGASGANVSQAMSSPSVSPAMAVQPRSGLARAVGLSCAVCAVCGVAFWAVAGGPGQARVAAPQLLYAPQPAQGALRSPKESTPEGLASPADPKMPKAAPKTPEEAMGLTFEFTPARGGAPSMSLEQLALNDDINTVVQSDSMCTRRNAMARAAGLAAGLTLATVNAPGYAAETKMIKMGSDNGQLVFVPDEVKICKGDTVTWVNNKGGPHNVVFDDEAIPSGVTAESISMDDQLGDEGATFSKKFDTPGTYSYFCEPHRGAGMQATLIVQ